jgi:hypothetical protein
MKKQDNQNRGTPSGRNDQDQQRKMSSGQQSDTQRKTTASQDRQGSDSNRSRHAPSTGNTGRDNQ